MLSTLKSNTASFSETSVPVYHITGRHLSHSSQLLPSGPPTSLSDSCYKMFVLFVWSKYARLHDECFCVGLLALADNGLQAGRSQVRFLVVSLAFFIDVILPAALWPWSPLGL